MHLTICTQLDLSIRNRECKTKELQKRRNNFENSSKWQTLQGRFSSVKCVFFLAELAQGCHSFLCFSQPTTAAPIAALDDFHWHVLQDAASDMGEDLHRGLCRAFGIVLRVHMLRCRIVFQKRSCELQRVESHGPGKAVFNDFYRFWPHIFLKKAKSQRMKHFPNISVRKAHKRQTEQWTLAVFNQFFFAMCSQG